MNKRLLIALVLSFVVLTIYGYFVPRPQNLESNKTLQTHKSATQSAPVAETPAAKSAPVATKTPSVKNENAPVGAVNFGKTIATVQTAKYRLTIDNLGRISSAILKESKYQSEDGKSINLIAADSVKPLEVRFKDAKLNKLAFATNYSASAKVVDAVQKMQTLELTQKLDTVRVKKLLTFYPDGHYDLKIEAPKESTYFITPGLRPMVDTTRYMVVRGVLVRNSEGIIETIEEGDIKAAQSFTTTDVLAAVDRYYTTLFYSKSGTFTALVVPSGVAKNEKEPLAFVQAKGNLELEGYIGPKEWKLFNTLDKKLEDVVEFGWFTFLSKPFFKVMYAIYNFTGNWGWAIVLFTLLVKIVLFPLSYKGLMSMQKLKDLAPKMKELKEKYGKDPAKMNQQMMQLYKKHGANPMGGCLPMILQIPIFFALYRVLLNADELQGAPWILWIQDLSHQDPYFVLPILMGVTMYLQQKITPNTMTDPTQKKIFQWLPVIMTFFFLTFPSGLVLYWLVNNILTIAQQVYINGAYERYKKMQAHKKS